MKKHKNKAQRALAILLSAALALALLPAAVGSSGDAEAAVSLPVVENQKYSGKLFSILEVLPDESMGGLGYYVDGAEPCADWREKLAKLSSRQQREEYFNNFVGELQSAGIMGAADDAPLTLTEGYEEKYPWELTDADTGFAALRLENAETISPAGGFVYQKDGAYKLTERSIGIADGSGDIVQDISHFIYHDDVPEGESFYWYAPSFDLVTSPDEQKIGTAIYERESSSGNTVYKYIGTVGHAGFSGFESGKSYYTAGAFSKPSGTRTDANEYAAVSSGFHLAQGGETAHFTAAAGTLVFEYVGAGGNAAYNSQETQNTGGISTSAVFFKGGYKNNNWFLRYVLDWEEDEPVPTAAVQINAVSGNKLTVEQVVAADMIVLSPSIDASGYSSTSDISEEVSEKIAELCAPPISRRVVVDSRLADRTSGTKIGALAYSLVDGDSSQRVNGNVFCAPALLPKNNAVGFFAPLADFGADEYSEVANTIGIENERRGDAAEKLPEIVSIAGVLRHFLNGLGVVSAKPALRVLSIEPGKTPALTENTVLSWLGSAANDVQVNIKYVSTAEFIGMTEELCEKYDLIYIGANIFDYDIRENAVGIALRDFNDDSMDGMIYTNVGDSVTAGGEGGWAMTGLLDRDYDSLGGDGEKSDAAEFRYSGNDLTAKKAEEIRKFSQAGFPVVYSEDLRADGLVMKEMPENGSLTFAAGWSNSFIRENHYALTVESISEDAAEITVRRSAAAGTSSRGSLRRVKYRWHRVRGDDVLTKESEETSESTNTLKLEGDFAPQDGDIYYCELIPVELSYWLYSLFHWFTNCRDFITSQNAVSEKILYGSGAFDARVDSSSNMYSLLTDIIESANTYSAEELNSGSESLGSLGHYEIELTGEVNEGVAGGYPVIRESEGSSYLDFNFSLVGKNISDTSGSFTAELYIDLNCDGLYSKDELISEKGISLNQESTLSGALPRSCVGMVQWKLSVRMGGEVSCCSETGYAYVTPETAKTVYVLQVNDGDNSGGVNLQANINSGGTFKHLLGQVRDYNVKIATVDVRELSALARDYSENEVAEEAAKRKGLNSTSSLYDFLSAFDVLILGFGEGYVEPDVAAADALKDYIAAERATIISRDNSSLFFSADIRDAAGMDRYGVVNEEFGLSKYSGARDESGVAASAAYLGMDNNKMLELTAAGYSIAYMPGYSRKGTVAETQGLTSGILSKYYKNGAYPTNGVYTESAYESAASLTQLNRGKITSYPFDMNMADFGGTLNAISVLPHVQHAQLNMNAEDVVVWYCLAGGAYDYMPNDAMNAYYIYTQGNITYTGFGLAGSATEIYEGEAKLLINAIVNAFERSSPEIRFTDASGTKNLESVLIPGDGDDIISSSGSDAGDPARHIYFTIEGTGASVGAEFFIGGERLEGLKIYSAESDLPVTALSIGKSYYISINDLGLSGSDFAGGNALELAVILNPGAGSDTLTLRKLNLFNLS